MTKKEEKKSEWYWEIWDKKTNKPNEVIAWLIVEKAKLEEENKKLKEDNRFLTKISKEYMEKEGIIEVTEFTELYKDDLEKENKKLKERIDELEKCNLNLQERLDRKEELNKSYRKEIEELKAPRNIRNSDEWRKTHPFG